MFDIGFWELLVIGVVLLLVMGPERLPEVAKQAAFFIRKARQGVYRLRSEMQDDINGTPFADLEAAKREIADLKNDVKQFGRDIVDSVETQADNNGGKSDAHVADEGGSDEQNKSHVDKLDDSATK